MTVYDEKQANLGSLVLSRGAWNKLDAESGAGQGDTLVADVMAVEVIEGIEPVRQDRPS